MNADLHFSSSADSVDFPRFDEKPVPLKIQQCSANPARIILTVTHATLFFIYLSFFLKVCYSEIHKNVSFTELTGVERRLD